jgi:hypothetical protein
MSVTPELSDKEILEGFALLELADPEKRQALASGANSVSETSPKSMVWTADNTSGTLNGDDANAKLE